MTSPELVNQEKLSNAAPAPPVLPVPALPVPGLPVADQSMTGSESLVGRTLLPISSPSTPALDRSTTGLELVGQKENPPTPKQMPVSDKAPKPTLGRTSRQRVERPSLYDNPASPDSGQSRNQKPTGRPLVPSRRTRSAASSVSSVSTRRSKRVK
jgi:hypothetical protein